MPDRRRLTFGRLDEIMPDVDALLPGYRAAGRWSLGQICHHLAGAIVGSVDGFKQMAPWPVRVTIGPIIGRSLLRGGEMARGLPTFARFVPPPGLDDRAEAEGLRAAIGQLAVRREARAPHPFFGRLTVDQWDRFHRIHAAHHLGFVIPDPSGSPGR